MRDSNAPLVYDAADRWVHAALKGSDSLFTSGTPIWSDAVIGDLYEKFVENPDTGSRSFEEKFRDQLSGAAPDTAQLAAELLFVHFLAAIDMTGDHERGVLNTVLGWSASPVPIPPDLAAALDGGFSATGVAFRTRCPFQLTFLLEFVKAWKTLSSSQQDRLLADPWAFKEFVFALPIQGAQTQRCVLLHLVHPDTFESITSENMKQRIERAFAEYVTTESGDVDRQLEEIRAALTEEYGRPIRYWDDDVKPRWAPPAAPPPEQTAWVLQASPEIYASS
jgi:5-methylcytosine-specific restriction protein B